MARRSPSKLSKRRDKERLVRNHSTNLQGLLPILNRLRHQPGIATLTPAVIGRARSHAPQFRLKVSVPTQGGFKLIARQGKTVQEVFVTTHSRQACFGSRDRRLPPLSGLSPLIEMPLSTQP